MSWAISSRSVIDRIHLRTVELAFETAGEGLDEIALVGLVLLRGTAASMTRAPLHSRAKAAVIERDKGSTTLPVSQIYRPPALTLE